MRWAAIIVGYVVVAALIAVSMVANARFAMTLGSTDFEREIFVGASLAVDAYKALGLFFIVAMFTHRARTWGAFWSVLSWAALALAVWVSCLAWSTASAIGFAALTRGDAATGRAADADARGAATARVRRIEGKLAWASKVRPTALIEVEIARHNGIDPLVWTRTKECTDVTKTASAKACDGIAALRAELESAKEAAGFEAELAAARAELEKAGGALAAAADPRAAGDEAEARADPQAAALAALAGLPAGKVKLGLGLLLAALIEALSGVGFTIVTMAARRPKAAQVASTEAAQLAPTGAPIPSPTGAPIPSPTRASIPSPTGAPIPSPTRAASPSTTGAAIPSPTRAAIPSPTGAAIPSPTGAAIPSPTGAAIPSPTGASVIGQWAAGKIVKQRNGRLPVHQAFEDFSNWCADNGHPVPKVQMFGRGMTEVLRSLGGNRREVNGRPVYVGIVLAASALRLVGGGTP